MYVCMYCMYALSDDHTVRAHIWKTHELPPHLIEPLPRLRYPTSLFLQPGTMQLQGVFGTYTHTYIHTYIYSSYTLQLHPRYHSTPLLASLQGLSM